MSTILTNNTEMSFYICHCLPPDRTRHKVNDPKVDYSGDLGEEKVGQKPRLEPRRTVLFIDPLSVMLAR